MHKYLSTFSSPNQSVTPILARHVHISPSPPYPLTCSKHFNNFLLAPTALTPLLSKSCSLNCASANTPPFTSARFSVYLCNRKLRSHAGISFINERSTRPSWVLAVEEDRLPLFMGYFCRDPPKGWG